MSKHTPGPWDEVKRIKGRVYIGTKKKPIADICTLYGEESEANACLIAAAPDLYEACKEFVRKCECGEAKSKRSYAQMKAALAKARGEDKP